MLLVPDVSLETTSLPSLELYNACVYDDDDDDDDDDQHPLPSTNSTFIAMTSR